MRGAVPRALAIPAGIAAVLAVAAAGCDKQPLAPPRHNLLPHTTAWLPATPESSLYGLYVQTMHWWGEDRDGEVVGYQYRILCDPREWCRADTTWRFTAKTESTFYLPAARDTVYHVFEVRAVDNDGGVDPNPARVYLGLTNHPPSVAFVGSMPDTTLPAVTFTWQGTDPDLPGSIVGYQVWLDGDETHPRTVTGPDTTVTLVPADFGSGMGRTRTVFVRAIDSGSDTSAVASHQWFVRDIRGARYLLVDDAPGSYGLGGVDDFYTALMDSVASRWGESYVRLDLGQHSGFANADDVLPALSAFDYVVWYTGQVDTASSQLKLAGPGIQGYLDQGGALFLESMVAVGTNGALSEDFARRYLGIDTLYYNSGNRSTNFSLLGSWRIHSAQAGLQDIYTRSNFGAVELFSPPPDSEGIYSLPAGTIHGQTGDWFLGILHQLASGGRSIFFSFPISRTKDPSGEKFSQGVWALERLRR